MPTAGQTLYPTPDTVPGADGTVLTSTGPNSPPAYEAIPVTGLAPFLYGTGVHGVVDFDGTNTFAAFASKSGNTYTLTADLYGTVVTVRAGVTLQPVGFQIHASTSLTVLATGVITDNGNAAVTTTAGAALSASGTTQRISGAGGNGRTTDGNGTGGNNVTNISGGAGGNGGTGGAATGGTGASGSAVAAASSTIHSPMALLNGRLSAVGTSLAAYGGGAGGGGGGFAANGGTGASGAGGGGGGIIFIRAKSLNNLGTIRANGGAGSNASTSTGSPNAGGGGGGGGGAVLVLTSTVVAQGTITAAGGSPGTGVGTGTSGVAGSTGTVYILYPA